MPWKFDSAEFDTIPLMKEAITIKFFNQMQSLHTVYEKC